MSYGKPGSFLFRAHGERGGLYTPFRLSALFDLVQAADLACGQGKFAEAIERAAGALEIDPSNEQAQLILADAYSRTGEPLKAAEVIGKVLSQGSTRHDLVQTQARLLRMAGRPQDALPLAARFASLQPKNDDAHAFLGVLRLELGMAREAAASFREAGALKPDHAPHQFNLATALLRIGQDAEALEVLNRLTTESPGFLPAHITLGDQLLKRGLHQGALAAAQNALVADPNSAQAHIVAAKSLNGGATSLTGASSEEEAEWHLRQAIALGDKSAATHVLLAFTLQQFGRFEESAEEFEHALRLNPRNGPAYYGLATCRRHSTDDHVTTDRLKRALEMTDLSPLDRSYIHYALGKVLEDRKDFEQALNHFDRANELMFEMRAAQRPFRAKEFEEWTSRLIETFDEAYFERKLKFGCPSELPMFVVGMMRSGTTLTEQILSSHPQIAGAGELPFWPERADSLKPEQAQELDRRACLQISEDCLRLLALVEPTALRVTDKLPRNTMSLGLIHAVFPNARIVACRRHPVDTSISIYTTPYGESPAFAHSRRNIVTAFQQHVRLMDHWRKVIPPDRLLEIDYEELIADRATIIRRMIAFTGLAWDDVCLRHEENKRSVRTPSRWQVRQPLYSRSIARWKNYEPWLGEFRDLFELAE